MDIEQAANVTFDSLTLREKDLARELVRFEGYDKEHLSCYFRAPVLYLDNVLQSLKEHGQKTQTTPRRVELYCDTLIIRSTALIESATTFFCYITARQIEYALGDESVSPAIRLIAGQDFRLSIHAQSLPSPFEIDFQITGQDARLRKTSIPEGAFGFRYIWERKQWREEATNPPNVELSNENWMSMIKEDGTLSGTPFLKDNLPRLLNFQYLVAASHVSINPALSMSLLNWVCLVTSTAAGSMLNAQANSLRTSLAAQFSKTSVSSVPSLNIYSCKQILKSRLLAAQAFEDSFQTYMSAEQSAVNWVYSGADLIRKSDNALDEYNFLSALANKRYDEALEANTYANKTFQDTQTLVNEASAKFKDGVAEWEKDQKIAAAKEIFSALISVGIAIAATVATGGLAAPGAISVVGKVGGTVSRIAKAIAAIKKIIETIQELYEKLEPIIEKLSALFEAIKQMVDAIRRAETALGAPNALKQGNMKLDALNAIAQWDIFDLQVGELEKEFKELDIPNQKDYLLALRSLVVYGKTFLLTQVNLVARGDELATVLLRLEQQKTARPSLEAMMKHFSGNSAMVSILKTAMFDRLMSIRALVFVDVNSYVNAYMYHSLASHPPVLISAVKPVGDYFADAARLQSAVSQFGSTAAIQRKSFKLNDKALDLDIAQVISRFKADGKFGFTVSPTYPAFEGMYRVRLSRVRVHLRGLKAQTPGSLRFTLQTSGRFLDIPEPDDKTASSTRAFIGDPRALVFEKEVGIDGEETITCDGDYGLNRDYTMQTPFTEWTVTIAHGGLKLEDIDVQALTGVEVELLCEVCY
ncbi:hypothetical protein P154DRAFT_407341, partial [Amniculicola lignicola CBS 123094]